MSSEFKLSETTVELPLPVRYKWLPAKAEAAKEVVILLHGYMERAERTLRLLGSTIPDHASVLVPNGLFPLPIPSEAGFKEAYGWYFYDTKTEKMLITPDPAVKMIKDLLSHLKVEHLPIRVVGFSQGGYFAPYLAARLNQVRHVISLSAGFPERYFDQKPSFRLDAVHGTQDTVCRFEVARTEHKVLTDKGWSGEFVAIENVEHRIEEKIRAEVTRLLNLPLPERKGG